MVYYSGSTYPVESGDVLFGTAGIYVQRVGIVIVGPGVWSLAS